MKKLFILLTLISSFTVLANEVKEVNWSFTVETLKECFKNASRLRCDIPVERAGLKKILVEDVKHIAKQGGCSLNFYSFPDSVSIEFAGMMSNPVWCADELENFENPENEFLKKILDFNTVLIGI